MATWVDGVCSYCVVVMPLDTHWLLCCVLSGHYVDFLRSFSSGLRTVSAASAPPVHTQPPVPPGTVERERGSSKEASGSGGVSGEDGIMGWDVVRYGV